MVEKADFLFKQLKTMQSLYAQQWDFGQVVANIGIIAVSVVMQEDYEFKPPECMYDT
jgi:hypothetical protein